MTIQQDRNGSTLTIAPQGRLDTVSAPMLEETLRPALEGVKKLVFDLCALDYVSSAGLRVILSTQKIMNRQGSMVLRNVKPEIMDIFDVTGFSDFLEFE